VIGVYACDGMGFRVKALYGSLEGAGVEWKPPGCALAG